MRRLRLVLPWSLLSALSLACALSAEESADPPAPSTPPSPAPPVHARPAPPTQPPTPAPVAFDPRSTGTRVLARYQGGGAAYAAVVTGQSTDGQVNVVYADGDAEALPVDALTPDVWATGSHVEARIRTWPSFYSGRMERRIGHAVLVRFDDGDEQWTSIGLVRASADGLAREAPEAPMPPSTIAAPLVGAEVVADYQRRGWFYAGVIVEARADAHVLVVYADGDREWLPPDAVRADTIQPGTRVAVQPPRTQRVIDAEVRRRVGHAVEIQLEDAQKQWVALANVRVR